MKMIIKCKWYVVLPIVTLAVVYFLYDGFQKIFTSKLQEVPSEGLESLPLENANLSFDERTEGYQTRKLLSLDYNVNRYSSELKTELNPFLKAKFNNDTINEISKSFSYNRLGKNRLKKLSRRKRNVRHNDFGWKLNLNITTNKIPSKGVLNLGSEDDLNSKSGKEKFLNMAVQLEGESADNSFKELHQVWDSLGLFLKRVYGKDTSLKENVEDITAEISTESKDIESSDSPTVKPERERTPKLIFPLNIGSSENTPFDGKGITPENEDSLKSVTPQKTNVVPMEGQTSTKAPLSTKAAEAPIEAIGLGDEVNKSTVVPVSEPFLGFESTSLESNTQFVEKFDTISSRPIKIATVKPEPSFTSEQLKEFCISLLRRIEVSPKSVDHFPKEGGSGELEIMGMEDKETVNGLPQLSTEVPKETTNQNIGIWASIWNRFTGRRLVQDPTDVKLPSSITPKEDILEKAEDSTNEAFILKDNSTLLGLSDSTESEDFFSDDGSALTVPDCENFFKQIQNDAAFSKPNLLDILNNPMLLSLDPSNFNFTEIRDDKQMRSMRSDSSFEKDFLFTEEMKNDIIPTFPSGKSTQKETSDSFDVNELSNEQSDKNSFENTATNRNSLSTPNSFDVQESFRSGAFDKSDIDNLITENMKDLRKSATETAFLTEKFTTKQTESFTELLDDGLFIQSNAHTRTDSSEISSSEVSADLHERIFGIIGFGSGERNLEDSDKNVSEFPENRSFHPGINFESTDSDLKEEFSVNEQEITSTNTIAELNIFDVALSLRKEDSRINSTESEIINLNERNQQTENGSSISSHEKPSIEFQFDPKVKPTESENVLDLTNMSATQSISDQTPLQNIFDERQRIELQLKPEENFTGIENFVFDSNTSDTKLLLEDQTPFENVLDERSDDDESRVFPPFLDVFGSGDGRELSEVPTDPVLNSGFTECLDCFKNKSNTFPVDDDYDDCGSDINDTAIPIGETLSTTIDPLPNRIVSEASIRDTIYLNNKADESSESNQDPPEISTRHFPESITSSPVSEIYNFVYYYNYENNSYESTNNDDYDNPQNIDYDVNDYEHYDNPENIGYEITHYDNPENTGYEMTSYEYDNSVSYGDDITLQPPEHVHIEGECDESHFDTKTGVFTASPSATPVPEDLHFIDSLLLTGSGAGNLIGNDGGEINLVKEPGTTSFSFSSPPEAPRQSRRGGRMDDSSFMTWPVEKTSDSPKPNSEDTISDKKALQIPEEKGLGTDFSHTTTLGSNQIVENGLNYLKTIKGTTLKSQDVSTEAATAISIPTSSFAIPKKKAKDSPPRYCNHAGECDVASNEGCITKEGRGVCDCRRSFVRHPDTDICEAPFMMRTSLKLPGEVFHEDLRDKYSELYKNKTKDAVDTMWLVVYQDPTLENSLADIHVTGFEEGSLVIHWQLIFAIKNVSVSEIVQEVDKNLEESFKNPAVLKTAPLNVENVKMLSFSDINPCEEKELNYCSKDADCIRDEYQGFRCRCKDGYLDNSKNPMYPGEICIVACPPNFCGENGYCEMRGNGVKQCLCNGWYFGEKCNVSGILVISCFAAANVVLIILILAAVFFCRRRRQRRTRFYGNNQIMFQPSQEPGLFGRVSPRLAASIALDEMGPSKSKYMAISTPLYTKPDIQITSPSIIGSSISYDYDSTFDRTPSAEVDVEPPKYDSVPEGPKYNYVPEV